MRANLLLAATAALALSAAVAEAKPGPHITAAVADTARPQADVSRDAARKPAEMLDFAGVKAGMTVVDLIPGGGYFTRIFSKAVGPKGTVYAVSGPARPAPAPTPAQDTLAADPNYANVKSIHIPLTQFAVPTPADVVWTSQNYHDLKNAPNADMTAFNKAVYAALKPGGVYVVLDHVANPGDPNVTRTLHRIDPAVVKQEVTAAGFQFVGESPALRNPADDHTKGVREGSVQGHTDQFVYKFRKPS